MRKIYILLLASLSTGLFGQQLPLSNLYLVNRYSISPTYAGSFSTTALAMSYRNERINFPGASLVNTFSMDAPIAKNMALGGRLIYDQTDIFKHTYVSLSYTYIAKINDDQALRFSLYGGIYENRMDFSNKNLEAIIIDPVVADKMNKRGTGINSGFGILYNFKQFRFGLDIPNLVESRLNYKQAISEDGYRLRRTYIAHTSYPFHIKDNWIVEPIVFGRYTMNTPFNWEGAAIIRYKENYWISGAYRQSSEVIVSAGAILNKNIILNYSYEFSNKDLGAYNTGTHEIGIGFLFGYGKNNRNKQLPENYEEQLKEKIDSMQSQIDRLEKELEKVKQETDEDYEAKIDEMQESIDQLENNIETYINEIITLKENQQAAEDIPDDQKNYYIILDSYKDIDLAARGVEIWKKRGYKALVIHKEETGWYHVYSDKYTEIQDAIVRMSELRKEGLDTVWVLIYK